MLGRSGETAGHHTCSGDKARTPQSRVYGQLRVNDRGGNVGSSRVVVPMRQGLGHGGRFQVQRLGDQFHRRPGGVAGLVHRRWFRRSLRLCSMTRSVLADPVVLLADRLPRPRREMHAADEEYAGNQYVCVCVWVGGWVWLMGSGPTGSRRCFWISEKADGGNGYKQGSSIQGLLAAFASQRAYRRLRMTGGGNQSCNRWIDEVSRPQVGCSQRGRRCLSELYRPGTLCRERRSIR